MRSKTRSGLFPFSSPEAFWSAPKGSWPLGTRMGFIKTVPSKFMAYQTYPAINTWILSVQQGSQIDQVDDFKVVIVAGLHTTKRKFANSCLQIQSVCVCVWRTKQQAGNMLVNCCGNRHETYLMSAVYQWVC